MGRRPKVVAIVQARLGSTRFPNKIAGRIGEKLAIELLITQLSSSRRVEEICVAFPDDEQHRIFASATFFSDVTVCFGDELDVYQRFIKASHQCQADVIVRITADCPLIDPEVVDSVIDAFQSSSNTIIASNTHPPTFPDGLDCEVFLSKTLIDFDSKVEAKSDREHVTTYFYRNFPQQVVNYKCESDLDLSEVRLTIDEPIDLLVINSVFNEIGKNNSTILLKDIVKVWNLKPELFLNRHIKRNSGFSESNGKKLYGRAKSLIPGATMLFSKRAENFHSENWPTYYSKAKGITIWDLDGKPFKDFSLMGVGTNTLGYANDEVDEEVIRTIRSSISSTLINSREVELAEEIVKLHKDSEMVRFTRTGGEASAVAIRIARAHTKRDRIAFCGYHGWHDFYLSANLQSSTNLKDVLMPGLSSAGVPKGLLSTAIPFQFNNYESFDNAISKGDIAAVIMEVQRNIPPSTEFLEHVRKITHEKGIVLIFDECSSGFRETYGGIHEKFKVYPDILILGKALGNGYAINSISGPRKIMNAAQETFISSTSWSEGVGLAAGIATLRLIKREKSFELLPLIGKKVRDIWKMASEKVDLPISSGGLDAMPYFVFNDDTERILKTVFTQEMLTKGFLATTSFYSSTAHIGSDVDEYAVACLETFEAIKEAVDSSRISSLLQGTPAHAHFSRLN